MNTSPPKIIIAGSRTGIGKGIAEFFVEHNYNVIGISRGTSSIGAGNYSHFQADLTDEKEVKKLCRELKKNYDFIDGLICCVGIVRPSKYASVTTGPEMLNYINTNFLANFYLNREVSKIMIQQKFGRIVNLSSIMTSLNTEGTCAYGSTKKALEQMTKVLAVELAPMGVTCNCVCPAVVLTETVSALGEKWLEEMYAMQTMKRALEISELSHTIKFLISKESSAVTGQVINMCQVS